MADLQNLVSILWAPMIAEVKTGDPVFFCFYSDWLSTLLQRAGIQAQNPVDVINSAANSCFLVDGTDVELLPEVLLSGESGFSAAILLVCQQVLAVEEMVRQQAGYSENAYFPRLRAMISPDLGELSLNPFSFDEFEKIWRMLAQEVRSIKGSSDASITFRFGVEQGINKARSFPLSQALLSREDLGILTRRIGVERLRKLDNESLWALLRSEKVKLKRRSQRIMSLAFLRDRILEQTRSFADKVDPTKFCQEEAKESSSIIHELRFYKDSIDWYTDEFRAYLVRTDSNERIDDELMIRNELNKDLQQRGFLVLPASPFGDSWVKVNRDLELGAGDSFLLVGSKSDIQRAWKIIGGLAPDLTLSTAKISESAFTEDAIVQEVQWPLDVDGGLMVRLGGLSDRARKPIPTPGSWRGGVSVDNKRQKFLKDALPESIHFGNETLPISSAIKINDRYVGFDSFVGSLKELAEDQTYELQFPNGKRAKLGIAVIRGDVNDRMGFVLNKLGKISPILDRVTSTDDSIVGFKEPSVVCPIFLSTTTCAYIIRDLKNSQGRKLIPSEIDFIRNSLFAAKIPNEVKLVIERFLLGGSALSAETLGMLGLDV